MEMELIFISEISQLAPELFCLIASAQRGMGLWESQKRRVQCGIHKYESLTWNVDPPALLACNLTAISKSLHLQVCHPARLCKRWFNPGLSLSFQDSLFHQRASQEVKELPGDFFVLEGDGWINLSLPSCVLLQPVEIRVRWAQVSPSTWQLVLGDAHLDCGFAWPVPSPRSWLFCLLSG